MNESSLFRGNGSDNSSLECETISAAENALLAALNWWTEGVTQITVGAAGVAGNTICIFLLSRKELHNSFNQLLICLASFDLIYLLVMITESFQRLGHESRLHTLIFPHFLYPINAIAMSGSIYMTVAISIERYIAVYHPMEYNRVMQDSSSHTRRLLCYLGPVLLLAVCFNIPKFLECKLIYNTTVPLHANTSKVDMVLFVLPGEPQVDVTDLRLDPVYVAYYHNWARLLVLGVVPMAAIAILNLKIYLAMSRRRGSRRGNEDSFTVVLMFIVITFIVCNLPRVILNMHEVHLMYKIKKCVDIGTGGFPMWSIILGFFSHILLVINSSANLFIYNIGAKFREVGFSYFHKILTFLCPFIAHKFPGPECICSQSTQGNGTKCRGCGKIRNGLSTFKHSTTPSHNADGFPNGDASSEKITKLRAKTSNGDFGHRDEKRNGFLSRPHLISQETVEDVVSNISDREDEKTPTSLKLELGLPNLDLVVAEVLPVETMEIQDGFVEEPTLRSVAPSITELLVIDPAMEGREESFKETAF